VMKVQRDLVLEIATGHKALRELLTRLEADSNDGRAARMSASLQSIDGHLMKIAADLSRGRDDMTSELRAEIRLLARTLAANSGS